MEVSIDIERLRRDLKDNFEVAMLNGFPMAVCDVTKIKKASPEDLVRIAQCERVDLKRYII